MMRLSARRETLQSTDVLLFNTMSVVIQEADRHQGIVKKDKDTHGKFNNGEPRCGLKLLFYFIEFSYPF